MFEAHGVDHLARSEHVGLQRGKSRSKEGSIGFAHAVQKGSGEGTARFLEIPVLGKFVPVNGDYGSISSVAVLLGHVPCRAGADGWWGAGNDVAGDHVPHDVGNHKGKGTSYVMLGTLVSGLGLDVLEPGLEVGSSNLITTVDPKLIDHTV